MRLLSPLLLAAAASPLAQPTLAQSPPAQTAGWVALQAGTVYLVEDGKVLTGVVTILVHDGKIESVGTGLAIPVQARVVDYGPDAVIIPGLVAASSNFGVGLASQRTADATVRAVDNFDPYSTATIEDIAGGVTSAYISPARGRLIAGQGAVVKLAGFRPEVRAVRDSATIDGSIAAEARDAPGYWEPPVPATVDVGLGVELPQLPRSTMGAIVALRELLEAARGGRDNGAYGKETPQVLHALMQANTPWRMGADDSGEIRALVAFAREQRLPLIVDGAREAAGVVDEIAAAGASVVLEVDVVVNSPGRDFGKDEEAAWPKYAVAAKLVAKGIPTAIATTSFMRPRNLRFAAALASRGGLDPQAALRAITLTPAEILGVAPRIGSISPGKDADFAVLNGPPLAATTSVLATWIDGETRWSSTDAAARGEKGLPGAVVLEVDALYIGDGRVLRPGQVLLNQGRIVEVGERVGHPLGCVVVRGPAAMPGIIDAFGYLGLEGSSKTPDTDFKLKRLVEPGDRADARVAQAGVTTVMLAPRGTNSTGAPLIAYKPAGHVIDRMVVDEFAGVRLTWSDRNRIDSGKNVRELLAKALEYKKKWDQYEEAKAKWVPPPQPPVPPEEAKKGDEKKPGSASDEAKKSEDAKKADEAKKAEEKKKKEAEEEGDPLNGIWEAKVVVPPFVDPARLRLRLEHKDGELTGSLRCDSVSDDLVELTGTYEEKDKTAPAKESGKDGGKESKPEKDAKPEKPADKEGGEKPPSEKPPSDKPSGDKPPSDKPAGDKPAGEDKPAPAEKAAPADKAAKDKPADKEQEPKESAPKEKDAKDSKDAPPKDSKDSKDAKKGKEKPKEKERRISASGLSSRGTLQLTGELKAGKLEGKLKLGPTEVAFTAERTSKELETASRPERRREKPVKPPEIKGEPKSPGIDEKLEPLRQAMAGRAVIIVDVDREDEILEAVDAFAGAGIKPVLLGADRAWKVLDKLTGRVSGVLLTPRIVATDPKTGLAGMRNRYADLAAAGIRVAFHSEAEEGASELPLMASYAISQGMSPEGALRALTADSADLLNISDRVGRLAIGLDGDVLLLDGPPLEPSTSVLRAWVGGEEVR
jgi:imidazolonepropionase-like amidohydrolase